MSNTEFAKVALLAIIAVILLLAAFDKVTL